MAVNIVLYKFSKKQNSTKRPDVTGDTYSCNLIEDCSFLNPKIVIVGNSNDFNPRNYNYAFIEIFDRHYYITDWTYSSRTWIATMQVDALASWRLSIGASTQYIDRCSGARNDNIVDTLFPSNRILHTERVYAEMGEDFYSNGYSNFNSGMYVLSVLNNLNEDVTEKNIVTYYAMTADQFKRVSSQIFTGDFWSKVVAGTLKFNDYILGLQWFPYQPSSMVLIGDLRPTVVVGNWPLIDAPAYQIARRNLSLTYDFSFYDVVKHPQSGTYGNYMNCSPWSTYSLYWPPIGKIPIDGRLIAKGGKVRLSISIDIRTGVGDYSIYCGEEFAGNGSGQFSVSVPCASLSADLSAIGKTMGSLVSFSTDVATGNYKKAALDVGEGFHNFIDVASPTPRVSGTYGNANSLSKIPVIYCDFVETITHNKELGDPLCENRKISSLANSFILISNPRFELNSTVTELEEINMYCKGGFYYE